MKILVVDDEDMILNLATKILERKGFEVVTAKSGDEALQLVGDPDCRVDLALVDLTMPGLSGIDTLRGLRAKIPGLPCVISSGQGTDHDDLPEEIASQIAFLQKPYRSDELVSLVNSILVRA